MKANCDACGGYGIIKPSKLGDVCDDCYSNIKFTPYNQPSVPLGGGGLFKNSDRFTDNPSRMQVPAINNRGFPGLGRPVGGFPMGGVPFGGVPFGGVPMGRNPIIVLHDDTVSSSSSSSCDNGCTGKGKKEYYVITNKGKHVEIDGEDLKGTGVKGSCSKQNGVETCFFKEKDLEKKGLALE